MMSSDDEKRELIQHPQTYFAEQHAALSERIKNIRLDPEDEKKIAAEAGLKLIRDRTLGLFKFGQIASAFLTWNENIEKEIKSAKRDILIEKYFQKNDKNEQAIQELMSFITNPQGNTLFNKTLRILDDSPPDSQLIEHLSSALKYMAENNFSALFERHKYALSQIEQITPQGLTILADHRSWPEIKLGTYTSIDGKIATDYVAEFTGRYASAKGLKNAELIGRLQHSIGELAGRHLIEAQEIRQGAARCRPTNIGDQLVPYLSAK